MGVISENDYAVDAKLEVGDSTFLGFVKLINDEGEAHQFQQYLKDQYPSAAHCPVAWAFPSQHGGSGYDEVFRKVPNMGGMSIKNNTLHVLRLNKKGWPATCRPTLFSE